MRAICGCITSELSTEKFNVYVTPAQHPITFMNIFCNLILGIMTAVQWAFSYRLHYPHYYTQEILYIYSKLEDEENKFFYGQSKPVALQMLTI